VGMRGMIGLKWFADETTPAGCVLLGNAFKEGSDGSELTPDLECKQKSHLMVLIWADLRWKPLPQSPFRHTLPLALDLYRKAFKVVCCQDPNLSRI
jgi:hypothetical protein